MDEFWKDKVKVWVVKSLSDNTKCNLEFVVVLKRNNLTNLLLNSSLNNFGLVAGIKGLDLNNFFYLEKFHRNFNDSMKIFYGRLTLNM